MIVSRSESMAGDGSQRRHAVVPRIMRTMTLAAHQAMMPRRRGWRLPRQTEGSRSAAALRLGASRRRGTPCGCRTARRFGALPGSRS